MNRIVIDAELAARIRQSAGPAELVDAAGDVIAVVHPSGDQDPYALVGDEFSPEEIERRCQPDRTCYTTEELLAKLRGLS